MRLFPTHTVLVDGAQAVVVQVFGHDLVPFTVRLSVVQSLRVRVWVKLCPMHTVLLAGAQAVVVQVFGHDLVPFTVRLSVLQSAKVRVCVKLFPRHTALVAGDQALIEHLFGGGGFGLQGPLSTCRVRVSVALAQRLEQGFVALVATEQVRCCV